MNFQIYCLQKKWKSMYKLSLRFNLNSRFFFLTALVFHSTCQVVSHHRCVLAPPAAEMVKHMRQHSETTLSPVLALWALLQAGSCSRAEPSVRASRASAFTSFPAHSSLFSSSSPKDSSLMISRGKPSRNSWTASASGPRYKASLRKCT